MEQYNIEQVLLFIARHLHNLTTPATLHYVFQQSRLSHNCDETRGIKEPVTIVITNISKYGSKDVKVHFLPDKINPTTSEISNIFSNPLVPIFLQWDVEKMARNLPATPDYFRHLIRQSLLDQVSREEMSVLYRGEQLKANKITLSPFVNIQNQVNSNYLNKQYEFIVASSIPGGIYSIKTILSDDSVQSHLIECTVLEFYGIDPEDTLMQKIR